MSGLDWPGLMRLGLQGLRLRPAEFWALTPVELRLMAGEAPAAARMDRTGLARLMAAFPDPAKAREDGRER